MDLNTALTRSAVDENDEQQNSEVYPGHVLRGEDALEGTKSRYNRKHKGARSFLRYQSSLKNMIPLRTSTVRDSEQTSKVDDAGLFSFITYCWVFPYLWAAFRGRVSRDQTWDCSIYDSSNVNMARLEYLWKQELQHRSSNPSLFRTVWLFIRTRIIISCIVFFFCLIFGFIGPICFVKGLVAYAEQPYIEGINPDIQNGLYLVFAIFIVEMARVLSYGATWAISYRTGIRVRGALLALLYKKIIYSKTLHNKSSAQIVNMFANDGQRLFDAISFAPLVLVGPLVLIVGIIYLLVTIGPWSLLGILIFIVFDAFQFALGKTMVRYRASAIKKTELRINLMGEIIRCIRVIKMNGWERSFTRIINELRQNEKVNLRSAGYAQSLAIAMGPVVPVVAAVVTFLGVILSGGHLLASNAFSAIAVFFVMLFGIRMVPYGSRYCAEAYVALKRIQEILLYPEYDRAIEASKDPNIVVEFKNCTLAWYESGFQTSSDSSTISNETSERLPVVSHEQNNDVSPLALSEVNLTVYKGELVGICGNVGSGKSALFDAIIGHLSAKDGVLNVHGPVALATQTPWILNDTVQNNILFGLPMNTSRFYRVIAACELGKDLETMKAGDNTEIGERGTTISGGQKARISLARALFSNSQLYLLDNVFSSLDQQVADRVFKQAVKNMPNNKTVMMISSDVELLSQCSRVCYMEAGRIIAVGTHEQLMKKCDAYVQFCEHSAVHDKMVKKNERSQSDLDSVKIEEKLEVLKPLITEKEVEEKKRGSYSIPQQTTNGQLVEEEENFGLSAMSWKVYMNYAKAAGSYLLWLALIVALLGNVASTIFSTVWLSEWLKHGNLTQQNASNGYYAAVYGFSVFFLFGSGLVKAFVFVAVSLNAATRLHNKMFRSIICATVQFFDMTPSGRILNRFSKDMDEIDVKLPFTAEVFVQNMLTCVGYLIMIAWVFPAFIFAAVVLFAIFALFFVCFKAGITCLKRSENISRSPLFDHITASMDGIQTIHSFNQTERFVETLKSVLDLNSGAIFMYQSAIRWLAVWLDLLVVAITFIVSLLIVLLTGSVAPSDAGMALAFAIQMSGIFQFAVRTQVELEAKMTSVERVAYYSDHVEPEGEWETSKSGLAVPNDWPNGVIEFEQVRLRYRPELSMALDDVSFKINAKDKIGIIGRTGSGKTSVCNALYRLYPLTWGTIKIDGINITQIGLHRLRKSMAIIPQDPILFAGTIRFNIDPNNEYNDEQIWIALEKAYIKPMVSALDKKLDSNITEGGRNISVGERQLFCLARAMLRKARIVIMDEATGSLDNMTDTLIQKCLSEAFAECTVIMIAHRLQSVLEMNKIIFFEYGKVVEYEETVKLLVDDNSHFRKLLVDRRIEFNSIVRKIQSPNTDDEKSSASSSASDGSNSSSPIQIYPVLQEASGKTSPETSEFERISASHVEKISSDGSDLEIITKSDLI